MKKRLDCGLLFLGFVLGLKGSSGTGNVSLTTAKLLHETTPKPTAMHRRINVGLNFENKTVQLWDLFRLKDTAIRRRSNPSVWNWDYWCQLQPKTGNCSESKVRYYYNAQLDQCTTFTYSGCGGNKNQFETFTECGRFCKGAIYMPLQNSTSTTYCGLQPDSGLCMALFYKFYYDVNENTCKTFIYGGCGGNQNRFGTMAACLNQCRQNDDTDSDV